MLWNGDCEDGNVIMKIVITGGSGFIGTNLIERFMSENYDVCNLDFNEPKIAEHKSIWKNVDLRVYTDVERELISLKKCGTADHKQSRPLMGRYNRKHSGIIFLLQNTRNDIILISVA